MKLLILSLVVISGFGCATGASKIVKQNKEGGRVMLIGSGSWMEPNSMKHAESEMKKRCPSGHEIVEEGLMERPATVAAYGQTHVQEKYIDFKCK